MEIKIEGFDEAMKALAEMPVAVQRRIAREALDESSRPMLAATIANAPVADEAHHGHAPGYMRSALRATKARKRRDTWSAAIEYDTKAYPLLITHSKKSGKRYFYPAAIEYGTARIKPRSFMKRAFEATKQQAISVSSSIVVKRIAEVFASTK